MTWRRSAFALAITVGVLICAWKLHKSRSFQLYGGLVTHVETNEQVVALTFDDGPSPYGTDRTLALLDSLDVRATFFLTGHETEAHPELAERIRAAGHELANHSYSHQPMVLKSPAFIEREVEVTDSLLRRAGQTGAISFRPPYGKRLLLLPRYLHKAHRPTVLWDIEPESYPAVAASSERIAAHVLEHARPGSIILLHVMYASRDTSREAIPLIVEGLRAEGFRFVTMQDLQHSARESSARCSVVACPREGRYRATEMVRV